MDLQNPNNFIDFGGNNDFADIFESVFGESENAVPAAVSAPESEKKASRGDETMPYVPVKDDHEKMSDLVSFLEGLEGTAPDADKDDAREYHPSHDETADTLSGDDLQFDPRFNISRNDKGGRKRGFSYGGRAVNTDSDTDYEAHSSPAYSELSSSYTAEDSYEALFTEKEEEPQPKKKRFSIPKLSRKRGQNAEKEITEPVEINAPLEAEIDPPAEEDIDISIDTFEGPNTEADIVPQSSPEPDEKRRAAVSVEDIESALESAVEAEYTGPEAPADAESPVKKKFAPADLLRHKEFEKPRKKKRQTAQVDPADELNDGYETGFDTSDRRPSSSNFSQYIASHIIGIILRIKGNVDIEPNIKATMSDDDDLGPEIAPMAASKYYGSQVYSLRVRLRIAVILLLIMCYISFGFPIPGMLQAMKVRIASVLALQLTVMLLALDVVTNAVTNVFQKKFGADSLAVLSCLLTVLDGAIVLNSKAVYVHVPLCVLSSLSLLGVFLSSLLSSRALRKSLRVPAIGKTAYTVTTENNITAKDVTILKSSRPIKGFVHRMDESPLDEALFRKVSPIIVIIALFFALIGIIVKKSPSNFIYILSAMLAPAVPFTALLCFALPFFIGSLRIFPNGAALAGWSGIYDLGQSHNIIVTDRDIFPPECIEIESVRIFADYDAAKVISYCSSLLIKSDCDLAPAFKKLMDENNCSVMRVDNLEFLAGGGMKGIVDGHIVLCGGSDMMRLMNVRVPYTLLSTSSVLLAIDGVLYGIFNIKYSADPAVRRALVSLMRSNRHAVFALRDFNVTPELIRDCFDVATDGYDFPPYVDRFSISQAKPARESQISAVVCREGLGPLIALADTGRSIYVSTRTNLIISIATSIFGMIFSFMRLMTLGYAPVAALFVMMIVLSIPVIVIGILTTSFS